MSERATESMMDKTIEKIKTMVDASTVIGEPITVGEVTLIPVSKVTYGFATGGSDLPSKTVNKETFVGGAGAGITVSPVAFLSICHNNVKLLPVNAPITTVDRVVEMVPEAVDKIGTLIQNRKREKTANEIAEELAQTAASEINENL